MATNEMLEMEDTEGKFRNFDTPGHDKENDNNVREKFPSDKGIPLASALEMTTFPRNEGRFPGQSTEDVKGFSSCDLSNVVHRLIILVLILTVVSITALILSLLVVMRANTPSKGNIWVKDRSYTASRIEFNEISSSIRMTSSERSYFRLETLWQRCSTTKVINITSAGDSTQDNAATPTTKQTQLDEPLPVDDSSEKIGETVSCHRKSLGCNSREIKDPGRGFVEVSARGRTCTREVCSRIVLSVLSIVSLVNLILVILVGVQCNCRQIPEQGNTSVVSLVDVYRKLKLLEDAMQEIRTSLKNQNETIQGSLNGTTGPAGPKGETGSRGDKGDPCQKGPPASMGQPGHRGPGSNRSRGPPGSTGPPGPPGPTGQPGVKGIEGPKGLSGNNGTCSCSSSKGPPGPKGDPGQNGLPGSMGLDGHNGSVGPQGSSGLPGPPGLRGQPGVNGTEGPKGPPGNNGTYSGSSFKGAPGGPGPPGLPGAGNLTRCVHKFKREVAQTPGKDASSYVIIRDDEPGMKIVAATCSTELAKEYVFTSDVDPRNNVRVYRCECKGTSSLFWKADNKMICIIFYWLCPLIS